MLSNINNALYQAKKVLYSYHIMITGEQFIDEHRKCILRDNKGNKWLLSFKRQTFHAGKIITGSEGEAESINLETFLFAINQKEITKFLFAYENGTLFYIRSMDLQRHATVYENHADHKTQLVFPFNIMHKLG